LGGIAVPSSRACCQRFRVLASDQLVDSFERLGKFARLKNFGACHFSVDQVIDEPERLPGSEPVISHGVLHRSAYEAVLINARDLFNEQAD
jgi:hypothetical protein